MNGLDKYAKYTKGYGLEISRNPYIASIPNAKLHFFNASCKDATRLVNMHDKFDFVLVDQEADQVKNFFLALSNWCRVLNHGGHIIIKVKNYDTPEKISRHQRIGSDGLLSSLWSFSISQKTDKFHLNVKKSFYVFKSLNLNLIELEKSGEFLWFVLRKKYKS